MGKILLGILAVVFVACNDNAPKTEEPLTASSESKAMTPANMHGFTPKYSSSFVMDDAKNSETVLALWKHWKSGDLSGSRSYFADTVSFFMADGTSMRGPTDSLIKGMQEYRNSFKSMEVIVEAIMATKSTDKDENWVAVWGIEMPTDSKGKTDTISLQETWGFNKAGKVHLMFQATRKGMLPEPPAK